MSISRDVKFKMKQCKYFFYLFKYIKKCLYFNAFIIKTLMDNAGNKGWGCFEANKLNIAV